MNYSITEANHGRNTVLRVAGELDALTSAELRPTVDALVHAEGRKMTVDLSELRLIDGSGVGALVSLYKSVRAGGGDLRFVGVAGQPLMISSSCTSTECSGCCPWSRRPLAR